MTPKRLIEIMDTMGAGSQDLAEILSTDKRMIRRFQTGARVIPDDVAAWLEEMATLRKPAKPAPVVGGRTLERRKVDVDDGE